MDNNNLNFIDKIFDTVDKQEGAIKAFESLKVNPGWILMEQIIQANIDFYTNKILDGSDSNNESAKKKMDRMRDFRNFLVWFKDEPNDIIERYSKDIEIEETNDSSDPYPTS